MDYETHKAIEDAQQTLADLSESLDLEGRKKRIAAGAGVPVQEVNRLLKQFEQTQDMMKRMKRGGLSKMMRMLGGMKLPGMGGGFPGGFPPGGFPGMPR